MTARTDSDVLEDWGITVLGAAPGEAADIAAVCRRIECAVMWTVPEPHLDPRRSQGDPSHATDAQGAHDDARFWR